MPGLEFHARHSYPSGFTLDAKFTAGAGVTALFGPSGGGKTTALGIIAGTIRPRLGRVRLGERTLCDTTAGVCLPPERRSIGYLFQEGRLFPHRTVEENLRFGQRRRPARIVDFARVVEILELGPLVHRYPDSLSGGQQQRVALGRAVLRGPELLLLDEPLSGLEEDLKARIAGYLRRLIAELKVPAVLVSHDQLDVRRLAEHVVILDGGRVVNEGPVAATLDRAILSGGLVENAPLNFVRIDDVQTIDGPHRRPLGRTRLPHAARRRRSAIGACAIFAERCNAQPPARAGDQHSQSTERPRE